MNEYKQAYEEGKSSAKFLSGKQALIRGGLHGIILATILFAPVPLFFRIVIGIVLWLLLGIIGSSKRFAGKI